jgi:hypothetical protein
MKDYFKLLKLVIIKNSISLICFTILAIIFNKWWIIFFSALFMSTIEKEGK